MKVSVALICYNSEKYIIPQIDTILVNLKEDDELVISDDGSKDSTIDIINDYLKKDKRVKFYQNNHSGCNGNYVNAISHCNGDVIFLSDDDNVWEPNKVETVIKTYQENPKCLFVQHDCLICDADLNVIGDSFFEYRNARTGLFSNVMKCSYGGSLISFKKEFIKKIIPLPKKMPVFYDEWFGVMASKYAHPIFIKDKLSKWRRHEGSSSTGFMPGKKTTISKWKRFWIRVRVRLIKLSWALFK